MAMKTHWENAAVIGSGMMGPGIALTLALGGLRAAIVSRNTESAAAGVEKAHRQAAVLMSSGLIQAGQAEDALRRLSGTTDFEQAIGGADLVVESGPENMEFKQELFARM